MAENAPNTNSPPAPSKPSPATPTSATPTPSDKSGSHSGIWIVLILLIIGGVVGYILYAHRKKPPARTPPPITVSVTNAFKGSIDEMVPGLGTVTPVYTAMISPRVDGLLVKVNYTEGQLVTTNDLLAEIDPGPYAAMVTQAEGQLARDKALLEGAQIDLKRFQDAYAKNIGTNVLHAIPKQQVDDQEALVHQDEGTVKLDVGTLENAKVQLAYCYIHAPFAGRTGLRLIDPGNVVHAANTNALVAIAQLQPITVVFSVDEQFLPAIQRQLKAGHTMNVEAWESDDSHKLATGKFLTVDNLIDVGTRSIRIKALFDNADLMLFPNQFINAHLIIDTLTNVTLIPTAAIQRSPVGAFVYLVTNETVNVTNQTGVVATNVAVVKTNTIIPGISDADLSSVKGISPGEVVVTDNYNKLSDGMPVNVCKPGGPSQNGPPPDGTKKGGKKDKAKVE